MSASLVGSEMCIRDRPWQGRARENEDHGLRNHVRLLSNIFSFLRANTAPCLLYTSDAADDM
eukprot:1242567-Alexandrium_andersonii.AAC.1